MKTSSFAPVLALVLFTASPTLAVETTVTPTVSSFRQARQEYVEKRQEIRQEKKSLLDQLKAKTSQITTEIRTSRAQATAAKIRARLVARFDFLTKMKSTLAAKIVKLEAAPTSTDRKRDLTAAKAELAKFDSTKYQAALVNFDSAVAKIGTTAKPMTLLPEINQAAKGVNAELKALHQVLVATVKAIAQSNK